MNIHGFIRQLPITACLYASYGTWRFIAVFTRARLSSLSWIKRTRSTPSHTISPRYILMLSSLSLRFSNQHFVCIYRPSCACCIPFLTHRPWFDSPNNIWWRL